MHTARIGQMNIASIGRSSLNSIERYKDARWGWNYNQPSKLSGEKRYYCDKRKFKERSSRTVGERRVYQHADEIS